jgi:hypothetical protein
MGSSKADTRPAEELAMRAPLLGVARQLPLDNF